MPQELIYTSATSGLKSGSRGFCTVAATEGLPPRTLSLLESLSGYRHTHPPGQQPHPGNPVCYSHLHVTGGFSLLSRIADAGLDYSGRSNKLAHHLLLSLEERSSEGPAAMIAASGNLLETWNQPSRFLPTRPLATGTSKGPPCQTWQTITGDAAWAAVLAEAVAGSTKKQCYVVFEPSMPCLRLVEEALALLPESSRWAVTFSTFFTGLPPGMNCDWRFVLAGSREHRAVPPHNRVLRIDLTNPGPLPSSSPLTITARTGQAPAIRQTTARPQISAAKVGIPVSQEKAVAKSPPTLAATDDLIARTADLPPPQIQSAPSGPVLKTDMHFRRSPPSRLPLWIAIGLACVLLMGGLGAFLFQAGRRSAQSVAREENATPRNTKIDSPIQNMPDASTANPAKPDITPSEDITKSDPSVEPKTKPASANQDQASQQPGDASPRKSATSDSMTDGSPDLDPQPKTPTPESLPPKPRKRPRRPSGARPDRTQSQSASKASPKTITAQLQYLLDQGQWKKLRETPDNWTWNNNDLSSTLPFATPDNVLFLSFNESGIPASREDIVYDGETGLLQQEIDDSLGPIEVKWGHFGSRRLVLMSGFQQRIDNGLLFCLSGDAKYFVALQGAKTAEHGLSKTHSIDMRLNDDFILPLVMAHPDLLRLSQLRLDRNIDTDWAINPNAMGLSLTKNLPIPLGKDQVGEGQLDVSIELFTTRQESLEPRLSIQTRHKHLKTDPIRELGDSTEQKIDIGKFKIGFEIISQFELQRGESKSFAFEIPLGRYEIHLRGPR